MMDQKKKRTMLRNIKSRMDQGADFIHEINKKRPFHLLFASIAIGAAIGLFMGLWYVKWKNSPRNNKKLISGNNCIVEKLAGIHSFPTNNYHLKAKQKHPSLRDTFRLLAQKRKPPPTPNPRPVPPIVIAWQLHVIRSSCG